MGLYGVAGKYEVATLCDLAIQNVTDVLTNVNNEAKIPELPSAALRMNYGTELGADAVMAIYL